MFRLRELMLGSAESACILYSLGVRAADLGGHRADRPHPPVPLIFRNADAKSPGWRDRRGQACRGREQAEQQFRVHAFRSAAEGAAAPSSKRSHGRPPPPAHQHEPGIGRSKIAAKKNRSEVLFRHRPKPEICKVCPAQACFALWNGANRKSFRRATLVDSLPPSPFRADRETKFLGSRSA